MIDLQREIINAVFITVLYVIIFIVAETVHRLKPTAPEWSRKFAHFLCAIIALSFPYLLKSHWTVLLIALVFFTILLLMRRQAGLKSVFGIERKSYGVICFPVAIYLTFLLGHKTPVLYFIAILVLAVSDVAAALIGTRYGSIKFKIEGYTKSLEGSISFFFATFLCVHVPLLLMTPVGRLQSILIALVIAILVTVFELISFAGSDNVFIPLGTLYILAKMTRYPLSETLRLLVLLLFIIAITLLLFWRVKVVKWNGVIGMILLNFAAWSLLGFAWLLPLFLSEIVFFFIVDYIKHTEGAEISSYQIKVILYTAIIPAAIIFITNKMDNQNVMYLPFLAASTSQMALISNFLLTSLSKQQHRNVPYKLAKGIGCTILSVITIASLPILLYQRNYTIWSIAVIWTAAVFAYGSNLLLTQIYLKRLKGSLEGSSRFPIRLISTVLSVIYVLLIQYPLIPHLEQTWIL